MSGWQVARESVVRVPFAASAALYFLLLAVANFWPIFVGYVPLPIEIVLNTALWTDARDADLREVAAAFNFRHAEMGDLVAQIYLWRHLFVEHVRQGTFPLWDPQVLMGHPLQANMQSAIFYPGNLVYLLLPLPLAWAATFLVRTVLAGLFAALFVRALGLPPLTALVAGTIYTFSGFMVGWGGWPVSDAGVWLPAACLAVLRLVERRTLATVAVLALTLAMPVLAGHAETVLNIAIMVTVFGGYRLLSDPEHRDWRGRSCGAGLLVAAALLGIALAAIQLLPTLEWMSLLQRSLAGPGVGPRPFAEWVSLLSRDTTRTPNAAGVSLPEGATYAGLLALVLAPMALFFHRPRREPILFAIVALCAHQFVYGWGPLAWLQTHGPIRSQFPGTRSIVLLDFSLAVLAAYGLAALYPARGLLQSAKRRGIAVLVIGLTGGALAVMLLRMAADPSGFPPLGIQEVSWLRARLHGYGFGLILLGLGIVLATGAALRPFSRVGWPALLLCAVDMVTFSHGYVPFYRATTFFHEPTAFEQLRTVDASVYRVAVVDGAAGPPNWEIPFGHASPTGQDYVTRLHADLLSPLTVGRPLLGLPLVTEKIVASDHRLLDLLNVKYLIATTDNESATLLGARPDRFRPVFDRASIVVYENPRVLPRAFLVPCSGVQVVEDAGPAMQQIAGPDFDPGRSVLLQEHPPRCQEGGSPDAPASTADSAPAATADSAPASTPGSAPASTDGSAAPSTVDSLEQGRNKFRARVQVGSPSILVWSEMYYPGWRAYVDGQETPVLRVNHALKGVALRPGATDVRFVFDPMSFKIGLAITLGALVIAVTLLAARPLLRKSRAPAPPLPRTGEGAGG